MEDEDGGVFHESKFIDQNGLLRTTRVPVVQELARQGIKHIPMRFITLLPPQDHPTSTDDDHLPETFPSIDVSKLRAGSDSLSRTQELARLGRGAREWGMFLITNHGIDNSVLDDVKGVVRGFFGLPFEEKKASVGSFMSVDNMGYGRNFVTEDQPLDWIDRLTMEAAPKEATKGLLVWPQKPANFRQAMEKYVEGAREVFDELLQDLAECLSLGRQIFLKNFDTQQSEIKVRVNYYPRCPRPDLTLGISPHSDGSSGLTLIYQFGATGGLQVLKDTKWITVPWPCDTLLVSFGDLLEIMSNGKLKSPWHRVRTQMEVERFSVALFYNPPPQAEIGPVGEDEGYKKVVVEEYVKNYNKISPTPTKQAIKFATV